ncbi:hypothetical protein [Morganella morganii]|uniref:hypothetical protein n=1 Tax=Morganella morganii TaxID=582 RepID=UPI000CF92B57|nr:hypothetical protein [Morganella morganii]
MIAIVFPHVYCNDGIITDLSGYGFIPENLGLEEKLNTKLINPLLYQKSVTAMKKSWISGLSQTSWRSGFLFPTW